MALYVIGVIKKSARNKDAIGYRLFDSEADKSNPKRMMDTGTNSLKAGLNNGVKIENVSLDSNGEPKGINGDLSRYPVIVNGKVCGNSPCIILNKIGDIGYTICDFKGEMVKLKEADVVKYATEYGIANGKVVDGHISSIYGTYEKQELPKAEVKKEETPIKPVNISKSCESVSQPVVKDKKELEHRVAEEASKISQTLQEEEKKRKELEEAYAKKIRRIAEENGGEKDTVIEDDNGNRVMPANEVRGAIVDVKNPARGLLGLVDEVTGMTVEQKITKCMLCMRELKIFYHALFVNLKKIPVEAKIVPTMGVSINKLFYSPEFVRDLSIPELLFVELHEICHVAMKSGVRGKGKNHEIWNIASDLFINKYLGDEFGVTPGSAPQKCKAVVGDRVIEKKFEIAMPQSALYNEKIDCKVDTPEKIYSEIIDDYNKKRQKQNQQNQQNQNSQSQQGQGGQSQQSQPNQGQQGQQGQSQQGQGGQPQQGQEQGGAIDVDFRGTNIKIEPSYSGDLVSTPEDAGLSDEAADTKANAVINNSLTRAREAGEDCGTGLARLAAEAIAPKINWKSLVNRYLLDSSSKIYSYSNPDRRFIHSNTLIPGPRKGEPDALDGVKVCIDTSGSISDKEIGIALAQMHQLLKKYDAKAEMIYWDTRVWVAKPFTTAKEMFNIKPEGGGGTDINCVFEYLTSKKCKVKPKFIIVFTDGYFGELKEKYKKFGKDIVWVIVEGCRQNFKKPCGKVADLIIT